MAEILPQKLKGKEKLKKVFSTYIYIYIYIYLYIYTINLWTY